MKKRLEMKASEMVEVVERSSLKSRYNIEYPLVVSQKQEDSLRCNLNALRRSSVSTTINLGIELLSLWREKWERQEKGEGFKGSRWYISTVFQLEDESFNLFHSFYVTRYQPDV